MAFKLEVGQYYEADSPIHALDARVKFCCAFVCMIALFCAGTPAQLAIGAAFTVAVVAASRVPVGRVAASVEPLVFFLGFLSLFNLIFVQTGNELLVAGPVRITDGGVWAAVLYTVRFGLALMLGSLILLTTTPTELSDAFDAMLGPLARLGLPAHEIAMVFSLMLRFVPTLADEASAILDAQAMRGGGFDEGGPVQRVRAIVHAPTFSHFRGAAFLHEVLCPKTGFSLIGSTGGSNAPRAVRPGRFSLTLPWCFL